MFNSGYGLEFYFPHSVLSKSTNEFELIGEKNTRIWKYGKFGHIMYLQQKKKVEKMQVINMLQAN